MRRTSRPAALNRWNQQRGTWRPRYQDDAAVQAEADRFASTVKPIAPLTRIAHPVITEPTWTTQYRVTRRFRNRDHGDQTELIGETNSLNEAMAIARTEIGAAFVTDRHGKQVSFNYQPTEIRA